MKKNLITLFCLSALFLGSCSDDVEQGLDKSNTIGIVLYEPLNEFRSLTIDYAVKKTTSLGYNYILKLPANAQEQKKELQKLADLGVKCIVFGDLGVDAEFLNSLISRGVDLVLHEGEVACNYAALISGDNKGLGERAGEFFSARSDVAKIVALTVSSSPTISDSRINGLKSKLGTGKTVVEIPMSTYSDGALMAVLDQIVAANPDGIYTQDDMVAYALVNALKDKTHNVKTIFGAAGYQPYLRLMKTSAIDLGSASYSPKNIEACVEAAVNLTKGIKPSQKKTIIPSEMITKANVDQYLKPIGNF